MATHTCSGSALGPLAAALFCTCIEQNEFLIFLTELTGKSQLQRTCGGDASLKRTQTSLTRENLAVAMFWRPAAPASVHAAFRLGCSKAVCSTQLIIDTIASHLSACIPLLGVLSERIPPLCPA